MIFIFWGAKNGGPHHPHLHAPNYTVSKTKPFLSFEIAPNRVNRS